MSPIQLAKDFGQLVMLVIHSIHAAPSVSWALSWVGLPCSDHGMWHVLGSTCVLGSLILHIVHKEKVPKPVAEGILVDMYNLDEVKDGEPPAGPSDDGR